MKWQILIPTVVDRPDQFARLRDTLAPQVEKYKGDIEVMVFYNNYERELSGLRQLMIESTTADYINFIDDDDNVSDNYCDAIYPLLDGVDYIGFRVAFYQGNTKMKPVIHSLKCEKWEETGEGFYRRGTLINPTKREIMLKAGFKDSDYRKGVPEDTTYAENVDKLLKTENFVDEEIHIYMPTDNHAWSRFEQVGGDHVRPELPKYFKFHPKSTK
jgi:hypothetical protein